MLRIKYFLPPSLGKSIIHTEVNIKVEAEAEPSAAFTSQQCDCSISTVLVVNVDHGYVAMTLVSLGEAQHGRCYNKKGGHTTQVTLKKSRT